MFGINVEAIAQAGLIFVALIVFAESGLLVGFFLPGDTLLITVGVLAATSNAFTLPEAILAITIAAIVGDNVGYTIGQISGKRLFHKKDGILFRREYVEKAQAFYEKHGGKTIILARFVPIIRTFAPMVAGIGKMPRSTFFFYNVVGAVLWGTGVTSLGYFVGSKIPGIGHYLEYVVFAAMALTFAPALYHIIKDPRSREMIAAKIKQLLKHKPAL